MRIEERALDQIQPYEKNPRKNEAAVDKVAESLREFGWQQPIVTDREGVIIAGHTRLMAAQRLGLKTAPVVVAEGLSEEQVKAYRLADNKTNEFASWDIDRLDAELLGIGEMALFGFDMDAVIDRAADVHEDDYDPDPPRNPETQLGDVYELGEHRLVCGDATDPAVLEKIVSRGGCRSTIDGSALQRRPGDHGSQRSQVAQAQERWPADTKRQHAKRRLPAFFI